MEFVCILKIKNNFALFSLSSYFIDQHIAPNLEYDDGIIQKKHYNAIDLRFNNILHFITSFTIKYCKSYLISPRFHSVTTHWTLLKILPNLPLNNKVHLISNLTIKYNRDRNSLRFRSVLTHLISLKILLHVVLLLSNIFHLIKSLTIKISKNF